MELRNYRLEMLPFYAGTAESTVGLDREAGVLKGVQVVRMGEARGHGVLIDATTLEQVVALGNAAKNGVKARFDHPGMCTPSMGTYLGDHTNFRREGDLVRADLRLSKAANPSYAKHVLDMAEFAPDKMGVSIQFKGYEEPQLDEQGNPKRDKDGNKLPPFARVKVLRAADVVDEPAATDGTFSEGDWEGENPELSSRTLVELRRELQKPGFFEKLRKLLAWGEGMGDGTVNGERRNSGPESPERGFGEMDGMDGMDRGSSREQDGAGASGGGVEAGVMDLKALTLEELRSGRGDLVAQLVQGHEEKALAKGAEGERARVLGILGRAEACHFAKTKAHPKGYALEAIAEGVEIGAAYGEMLDLSRAALEQEGRELASGGLHVDREGPKGAETPAQAEVQSYQNAVARVAKTG